MTTYRLIGPDENLNDNGLKLARAIDIAKMQITDVRLKVSKKSYYPGDRDGSDYGCIFSEECNGSGHPRIYVWIYPDSVEAETPEVIDAQSTSPLKIHDEAQRTQGIVKLREDNFRIDEPQYVIEAPDGFVIVRTGAAGPDHIIPDAVRRYRDLQHIEHCWNTHDSMVDAFNDIIDFLADVSSGRIKTHRMVKTQAVLKAAKARAAIAEATK